MYSVLWWLYWMYPNVKYVKPGNISTMTSVLLSTLFLHIYISLYHHWQVCYVTPIMMCHSCSKDILVLKRCHLETFMLSHVTWNNRNICDTKIFRVFFSSASCPSSYSILVNGLFAFSGCYRKKRLEIRVHTEVRMS